MRPVARYNRFRTVEELEEALEELLTSTLTAATAEAPRAVMLSGGSTPRRLYERIAGAGKGFGAGAYLTVSDERIVPAGSPEANLTMIAPLARATGVPDERLLAVEHTLSPEQAAQRYNDALTLLTERSVSREIALLGIGGDGHTASIFDPQTAGVEGGALAAAVGKHAGFQRVTATAREILSYRRLIFFAAGSSKGEILARLFERPEGYPAGIIASRHPRAEIWSDQQPPDAATNGGGREEAGS